MFIYLITNKITGKQYVGQTTQSVEKRWRRHLRSGRTYALNNAVRKYGRENFELTILAVVNSIENLNVLEPLYIKLLNTISPNGYNLSGGIGSGSYISEEAKKKISLSKIGKPSPMKGRHLSAEAKAKISISKIGRKRKPFNEEARKHMSEAASKARKGMKFSEEHINNMSISRLGKKHSEITKQRMRESHAKRLALKRKEIDE